MRRSNRSTCTVVDAAVLCSYWLFLVVGSCCCLAAEKFQTVLALDLKGCPEGAALEWPDIRKERQVCGPPNAQVDRFFAGWTAALSGWMGTPSCLKVMHENGVPVLTNVPYGSYGYQARVLVGGKMSWENYTIRAMVRLVGQEASTAYGEHTSLPFIGVFARYQDLNRFYLFALRPEGVTLYRRANSQWIPLASADFPVAAERYYDLTFEARGKHLTGSVDGKQLLAADDGEYETGKVGVRFNTDIRVRAIQVTMDQASRDLAARREAQMETELVQARKRYPRPVAWKTLNVSEVVPSLGDCVCYPAHLRSDDAWDLLLTSGAGKTVALSLEGKVLWEAPVYLDKVAIGSPDAMGVSHVVGVSGGKLLMLEGGTGKTLAENNLPASSSPHHYGPWRLGNLTGKGQVNYSLRFGDTSSEIIVFDENLKELFRHKVSIDIGHTFGLGFWDIDQDGKEEILAGGSLLRGDGKPLWESRVTETHLDQVVLGPLGPHAEETAIFLGVDEGVFFLDGVTGEKLACVDVGHSQAIVVGNFRPDIPGLEPLVMDRWGGFGVTSLFTGRGTLLKQWMLASEEYYSPHLPVSWLGDGSELVMISRKFEQPTLYDGEGHEIFRLPVERGYYVPHTHLFPFNVTGDFREEIMVAEPSGKITIFTQDRPPARHIIPVLPPVKWMVMSLPQTAFAPPEENLLKNGGFEEVSPDGTPTNWTHAGSASLVTGAERVFAGEHAARVRFTDGFWQDFTVEPNTIYEVRGFVRHEQPGVDPGRMKLLFKDVKGTRVGSEALRVFDLSSVVYKPFRFQVTAPPFSRRCSFGILGRFTGSEWMLYDNVSVRRLR